MNLNEIGSVSGKNILFLQGPMGPFFAKLEKLFLEAGASTYRIGFNAGDYFFAYKHAYTPFRGKSEAWPDFIDDYLKEHQIEMIFLFGDCRFYQSSAIVAAKRRDIDVFVFEEGYIRPDYITLERYGVNDYSRIPHDPAFYRALELTEQPSPKPAHASGFKLAYSAVAYYAVANLFSWRYPHYRHHRDFSASREFCRALRNIVRKYIYAYTERGVLEKVRGEWSKRYFFVPLQTHNDFQILQHSHYRSVEKFIVDVLTSFSENAKKEHMLIFKHHPVDRGRKNYAAFIFEHAEKLGVAQRVKVLHDVHLPALLKHAIGTVTINSTVGLSSLHHKTPTVTMGNAIYGIEGLSVPASGLDRFWTRPEPVDYELYERFRQYLIKHTQLNGSFYGKLYIKDTSKDPSPL